MSTSAGHTHLGAHQGLLQSKVEVTPSCQKNLAAQQLDLLEKKCTPDIQPGCNPSFAHVIVLSQSGYQGLSDVGRPVVGLDVGCGVVGTGGVVGMGGGVGFPVVGLDVGLGIVGEEFDIH